MTAALSPSRLDEHFSAAAARHSARCDLASEILRELGREPLTNFADNDIYVYSADDQKFLRQIGCKQVEAQNARLFGLRLKAGEVWGYGIDVKGLGLWRPA